MSDEIDIDNIFDDIVVETVVKEEVVEKSNTKKDIPKEKDTKKKEPKKSTKKEKKDKKKVDVIKGKVVTHFKGEMVCEDCKKLKNNVSERTQSCYECHTKNIVKGKVIDSYNDINGCQKCGKLKNNISNSTGYCYECDHPIKDSKVKEKESEEIEFDLDLSEPEKVDKSPSIFSSEENVVTQQLETKTIKKEPKRPSKFRAITSQELDDLNMSDDPDFDVSEMKDIEDHTVYAFVGDKGSGKTTIPFTFDKTELPEGDPRRDTPTVICAISLDGQTRKIALKFRKALRLRYPENEELTKLRAKCKATRTEAKNRISKYLWESTLKAVAKYEKGKSEEELGYIHTEYGVRQVKEIHVWTGMRYYVKEPSEMKLKSAEVTYKYLKLILENTIAKLEPDYIFVDASTELSQIGEFTMRQRHGLGHTQGIKNRSVWKDRNDIIDHIIDRAIDYSVVAPIFSMFFKMQEVERKDGTSFEKKPNWVARIEKSANNVFYLHDELVRGERIWYGHSQSPKDEGWRTISTRIDTDMAGHGGILNLRTDNKVWTPQHNKRKEELEELF